MQLHNLKAKTKRVTSQQVGRGGTRGKTSGKGTKGQNARAGRKKRPELRDFIKRFPKLRGRGVSPLKVFRDKAVAVNIGAIDAAFKAGETVNKDALIARGLISEKKSDSLKVKILGSGELSKKLIFEGVTTSATAGKVIEESGSEIR